MGENNSYLRNYWGNPMPIRHLLIMKSMVVYRLGTLAMTGRAHCQRQVALFFLNGIALMLI